MLVFAIFALLAAQPLNVVESQRTFSVDYVNNTFLLDGKPFRYLSGEILSYRIHPRMWWRALALVRAAGFNVVSIYVDWHMHEPHKGVFDFSGRRDLEAFIKLSAEIGLFMILRPGPFIAAERNGGGLPYWLYNMHPKIWTRSSDVDFIRHVDDWWGHLLPMISPHMIHNGGNIIMVQIENEYGTFRFNYKSCDKPYLRHLRDLAWKYLGEQTVLFTVDNWVTWQINKTPGVLSTADWGYRHSTVESALSALNAVEPTGPRVNSEFYSGWLDWWGGEHQLGDLEKTIESLQAALDHGFNVNTYVFYGGTNFAFEAGTIITTSYDYDAPVREDGTVNEKYYRFRQIAGHIKNRHFFHDNFVEPDDLFVDRPRAPTHEIEMYFAMTVFEYRDHLNYSIKSVRPKSFGALEQDQGFVLYETTVKAWEGTAILHIEKIKNRAYVYVDEVFQGLMAEKPHDHTNNLTIAIKDYFKLSILLESFGRENIHFAMSLRGITKKVTLNGQEMINWDMYPMPLSDPTSLTTAMQDKAMALNFDKGIPEFCRRGGPCFYVSKPFKIECPDGVAGHAYLETPGWGKGVAFINNFNLGRFWPAVGPQRTLYIPWPLLSCKNYNHLVIFGLEYPGGCGMRIVGQPQLNVTHVQRDVYYERIVDWDRSDLFHYICWDRFVNGSAIDDYT